MSESSPLSGVEQKSDFGAVRSGFDPVRKSAFTQPLRVAPRPPAQQPSECQREITFVLGFQSRCANSVARRLDKPTSKLSARIS